MGKSFRFKPDAAGSRVIAIVRRNGAIVTNDQGDVIWTNRPVEASALGFSTGLQCKAASD